MNIALVYDRVNKFGGAERVLQALHEIWPKAPLFTSVYDADGALWAKGWDVRTSFLQKLPWARRHHELLGWLMPLVFESLDLSTFDVVLSLTSEAAKGVITHSGQLHLCYLLTPARYLWSHQQEYLNQIPSALKPFALLAQEKLRQWDYLAAQRPDHILAISKRVQARCLKYYRRASDVVYPPLMLPIVEQSQKAKEQRDYFLVVSRLVPYKRIDLAIQSCNLLRKKLLIIGSGSEESRLKKLADSNIQFLGTVSDSELITYYRGARALLMPQEEDLGLTALEAQACGTPVVTFRNSGAVEVIIEGKTGSVAQRQDTESFVRAIQQCPLPSKMCTIHANQFTAKRFIETFEGTVQDLWQRHHHISLS